MNLLLASGCLRTESPSRTFCVTVCLDLCLFSLTCVRVRARVQEQGLSAPLRDCLLPAVLESSGNKSQDGEGGCNIRVITARATNGCARRAPCAGIPGRAPRAGRSRGKLGHAAWAGEWTWKELARRYLRESRGELGQDAAPSFQHPSA